MPRIPERGRPVGVRPGDVGSPISLAVAPLAQTGRALEMQGDVSYQLEQRRAEALRQIELNEAMLGFQQGMNDLALAGEQETDPERLRTTFASTSDSLLSSTRESIRDPIAKLNFEEKALALQEEHRIRNETRSVGLLQDKLKATNEARALQLANVAAEATDPAVKQRALDEGYSLVDEGIRTGVYKATEGGDLKRAFLGSVEGAGIANGTAAMQSATSWAQVDRIEAGISRQIEASQTMGPEEKAKAHAAIATDARIAKDRMEARAKEFQTVAREQAQDRAVRSILGPPDQRPSASQILADPVLTGPQKEHYVELLHSAETGTLAPVNAALYNVLYQRVNDETRPDHITSVNEIYPFVGAGLDVARADSLVADIKGRQTQETKDQASQFNFFLRTVKPLITQSNMFQFNPEQDSQYFKFAAEAKRRFDAAVKNGENVSETVLNPDSKQYIGNIIKQFQTDPMSQLQEQVDQRRLDEGVPERGPQMLPGETMQEYLDRRNKK